MQSKRKHHDLIVAWAAGQTIEYFDLRSWNWVECIGTPKWNKDTEYRIKDKAPDDLVKFMFIQYDPILDDAYNSPNIKLTFDGKTKKLISAELLKDDKEW